MLKLLAALAVFAPIAIGQDNPLDELKSVSRITPAVRVYQAVSPAVVYIQTQTRVQSRSGFNILGMGSNTHMRAGSGTGVVIHEDGIVVTNYHVVRGADPRHLTVSFVDDPTVYLAELLSFRESEDLALLRIRGAMHGSKPINIHASHQGNLKRAQTPTGPRTKFPTVRMGISNDLMPGERVIAIGNPHGQTYTVSEGIISGLHRDVQVGGRFQQKFEGLIQTDASINLGNSGGPLLNVHGEMIGINTVMNTAAENIGFAIPVDRIREVLTEHLFPNAQSAWLGFDFEPGSEFRVAKVWQGSPAALAGICQGDRVISMAGKVLTDEASLLKAGFLVRPYMNIEILTETEPGKRIAKQLTPWNRVEGIIWEDFGVTTEVTEGARFSHVLVKNIRPGGPAAELGLVQGDWLRAAGFQIPGQTRRSIEFRNIKDLIRLSGALPDGGEVDLEIYRDLDDNGVFTRNEQHRGPLVLTP
ncbi:MAG: trypsin-like peptidase domain-containing protein [Planctomycetes bacterium]|nr:trypsin-like peptidase domain-containing protein [Planctomycetota bacterium]